MSQGADVEFTLAYFISRLLAFILHSVSIIRISSLFHRSAQGSIQKLERTRHTRKIHFNNPTDDNHSYQNQIGSPHLPRSQTSSLSNPFPLTTASLSLFALNAGGLPYSIPFHIREPSRRTVRLRINPRNYRIDRFGRLKKGKKIIID